jgi:hypothetical protein
VFGSDQQNCRQPQAALTPGIVLGEKYRALQVMFNRIKALLFQCTTI